MYVVNFFGAPCVGKSTLAANIFYKLKKYSNYNVELVTEVAKDLCWENNEIALHDQLYVAGCQSYRLSRLKDKVDIVVTDAPLLLQTVYYGLNNRPNYTDFENVIAGHFREYRNINFMMYPRDNREYEKAGRNYNHDDQVKITARILGLFERNMIDYIDITDDLSPNKIFQDILAKIEYDKIKENKE